MNSTSCCRLIVILVASLMIVSASIQAQAPDTLWSRHYGRSAAALRLYELPDSGFVMGGHCVPAGVSYQDAYVIRTDANGDTLWTCEAGQDGRHENANDMAVTAAGDFVLIGSRAEDAPYSYHSDVYLTIVSSGGVHGWESHFGLGQDGESGMAVAVMPDGGYILSGVLWRQETVYDDWLIKTTNLGIMQWDYHVTWKDSDHPVAVSPTSDGGFVVTGGTQSFDDEYDYDMFIHRFGAGGVEMWADAYGAAEPSYESANDIVQTSDGGYLLCGYKQPNGGIKDIHVVKITSGGELDWATTLGGTYHDQAQSCIETMDGNYAVSASWYDDGNWQTALIKFDRNGDTMWTSRWFDRGTSHVPYSLVQTSDGGYAIAGMMQTDSNSTAYLVKFDRDPAFDPYTDRVTDLSIPIDDDAPAADTLPILIPDKWLDGRRVVGVRVMVDSVEHGALDELDIRLSHEGIEVTLLAEGDASGANLEGTVFADGAAAFIGNGQAPYTGAFRAAGQLVDFVDVNPDGNWVLTISDAADGNDGVLKAWGITLLTDLATDVVDIPEGNLPTEFALSKCYPNPFNPSTTIEFTVPRRCVVQLAVFNSLGQRVKSLVNEQLAPGTKRVEWNGTSDSGTPVASGVYFYRLTTDQYVESRKMVLVR